MAFRTTQITEAAQGITAKPVSKSTTAQLLTKFGSIQPFVYGKAALLNNDYKANIQEAKPDERRNPFGSAGFTGLSNQFITVAALKDESNLCSKSLENSFYAYCIAKGLDPKDTSNLPAFMKQVIELKEEELGLAVEQLIWKGNTELDKKNWLRYIDGILNQVSEGAIRFTNTIHPRCSTLVRLVNGWHNMPVEIRTKKDCFVFIGQDTMDLYLMDMKASKTKVKKTKVDGVSYFKLGNTPLKMVATSGLNGTDVAVFARLSNFVLGINGDPKHDYFTLDFYDQISQYFMDTFFTLGITVIDPSQVAILKLK